MYLAATTLTLMSHTSSKLHMLNIKPTWHFCLPHPILLSTRSVAEIQELRTQVFLVGFHQHECLNLQGVSLLTWCTSLPSISLNSCFRFGMQHSNVTQIIASGHGIGLSSKAIYG